MLKKEPFSLAKSSVWNAANRYYIDGKAISISSAVFRNADCDLLRTKLRQLQKANIAISQECFDLFVQKFIRANKLRLEFIKDEAFRFVNETARNFIEKNESDAENRIIVSFSGGKDSTATADIVVKALGNPYVTHLFGNTTLEFPTTFEYADRYRKSHPMAEF